jgi:hypothetical protein
MNTAANKSVNGGGEIFLSSQTAYLKIGVIQHEF